jgi:FlaA1/EpsC-like NDP-sugar epimerase
MIWSQWKNPKLYAMLFADAIAFQAALTLAYYLRFEFELSPNNMAQMKEAFLYSPFLKLAVFYTFGLYRGMWRYSSLGDFWRLSKATAVSTVLIMAITFFSPNFPHTSRSVILLDGLLTFLLAGGLRITIRTVFAYRSDMKLFYGFYLPGMIKGRKGSKRVLIIGAGNSGEKILREIFDNPHLRYAVAGFLDDDPTKIGRSVHSVPVLGSVADLPAVVEQYGIQEIFIATPSASGQEMRRIVEACKACDVPYKTLPGIAEIIDGKVKIKALRDVNYEDLLGRQPVHLDLTGICDYLADRTVLITGCGGSIGSELCRQSIRFNPRELVLLDASEENLFHIQMELHHERHFHAYHAVLGKVQDEALMEDLFQKYRPQVIFHAAAYKHVPMLEKNPWEAISNNILGSWVVMEAAVKYEAERFVLVSTDKAVRPTNVMGASKRITELLLQSYKDTKTRFMAVRFGNVVGSSGSVIPLFRRQIEQGGPVTITHPEVTRYFMTIPEAVRLILQAGSMGKGGEIFILKMGTPVKIADMAKDLIRLSGKEPEKDIPIIFTGLREGEKLYEELITVGEGIVNTNHDKIMVLQASGNGRGGPVEYKKLICEKVRELCEMKSRHDGCLIRQKLHQIVPEYTPQETDCVL